MADFDELWRQIEIYEESEVKKETNKEKRSPFYRFRRRKAVPQNNRASPTVSPTEIADDPSSKGSVPSDERRLRKAFSLRSATKSRQSRKSHASTTTSQPSALISPEENASVSGNSSNGAVVNRPQQEFSKVDGSIPPVNVVKVQPMVTRDEIELQRAVQRGMKLAKGTVGEEEPGEIPRIIIPSQTRVRRELNRDEKRLLQTYRRMKERLTPAQQEIAGKYVRMLAIMSPEQVDYCMRSDCVDERVYHAVMYELALARREVRESVTPESPDHNPSFDPSTLVPEMVEKYENLRKRAISSARKHIQARQKSASESPRKELFLDASLSQQSSQDHREEWLSEYSPGHRASDLGSRKTASISSATSPENVRNDHDNTKTYRRMLRNKYPAEIVAKKMRKDGNSEEILQDVLGDLYHEIVLELSMEYVSSPPVEQNHLDDRISPQNDVVCANDATVIVKTQEHASSSQDGCCSSPIVIGHDDDSAGSKNGIIEIIDADESHVDVNGTEAASVGCCVLGPESQVYYDDFTHLSRMETVHNVTDDNIDQQLAETEKNNTSINEVGLHNDKETLPVEMTVAVLAMADVAELESAEGAVSNNLVVVAHEPVEALKTLDARIQEVNVTASHINDPPITHDEKYDVLDTPTQISMTLPESYVEAPNTECTEPIDINLPQPEQKIRTNSNAHGNTRDVDEGLARSEEVASTNEIKTTEGKWNFLSAATGSATDTGDSEECTALDDSDTDEFHSVTDDRWEAVSSDKEVESSHVQETIDERSDSEKADKDTELDSSVRLAKYFTMLKMGIPHGAVIQKMKKEECTTDDISAVVGESFCPEDIATSSTEKQRNKLVKLHWTPIQETELSTNTIWNSTSDAVDDVDVSALEQRFQKKAPAVRIKVSPNSSESKKAYILNLNRSNNVSIALKAFREFSYDELANSIAFLDPLQNLPADKIEFVKDLLPTSSEAKMIAAYSGPIENLNEAEHWFTKIVHIKRLEAKVAVLSVISRFEDSLCDTISKLHLVESACQEVMDSERLCEILAMVLRIGNIMNEGSTNGGVSGFKFESLLRLSQTKSSDGKSSLLDFLVEVFEKKNKSDVLDFISELPSCRSASRLRLSEMTETVRLLCSNIRDVQAELEALKQEANAALVAPSQEDDKPKIPTDVARSNVMKMLAARGTGTDNLTEVRSGLLAAIRQRTSNESSNVVSEHGCPKKEVTTEGAKAETSIRGAIWRTEVFLSESLSKCSELEGEHDRVVGACKELANYCCAESENGAITVLSILVEFASAIESSREKFSKRKN